MIASVGDALINSAVMFAVQLALIWFADKDDYGAYSLLMSYVLMGQAILSSVFGAPLITSTSPLSVEARDALLVRAVRWHASLTLALAIAAGGLLHLALPGVGALPLLLTLLTFLGLASRDLQRVAWAIEGRLDRALFSSLAFAFLTTAALLLIYVRAGTLTLTGGMAATGISAMLTAAVPMIRRAGRPIGLVEPGTPNLIAHARWTLPGVVVIWIQNNLYLTIVAVLMSLSAVAELSAARMMAMPYVIVAAGLLRLNQVRFGQQLAAEGAASAFASARRWMVLHLALGAALAAISALALALGAQSLVSNKYPNLLALASLWFLFAGASSARGSLGALCQARGAYRQILLVNLATVPTALVGMAFLVPLWGMAGAIAPLVAAELQFLLTVHWLLRNRHRVECAV